MTGFDSEGFHAEPATVTDIRQLDGNWYFIAETQVSLTPHDNRQLRVTGRFDEKLQSWNKRGRCGGGGALDGDGELRWSLLKSPSSDNHIKWFDVD